jgi:DedD protein
MARQLADEEDNLRRQARRRLIGAVALTTVVVVIVPMVLDSEPKPVGQNVELRIPDKDKAGEFNPRIDTIPASSAVAAFSASAPVPVSTVAPVAGSSVAAAPPVLAATPKAAAQQTEKPKSAPEQKPEQKPAQAGQDAKSTPAEQAKPPVGGFAVQVGAFSSADTAHHWQKNLAQQGFKAYTEKAGDKTRVRIGPYPTREAANKAKKKLEAKKMHVNVVELNS